MSVVWRLKRTGRPVIFKDGRFWLAPGDAPGTSFPNQEAADLAMEMHCEEAGLTTDWGNPDAFTTEPPKGARKRATRDDCA